MNITLFLTVLLGTQAFAAAFGMSIEASLNPRYKAVIAGQPLVVTMVLRATTDTHLDLGANRIGNLRFSITDPAGNTKTGPLNVPDFTTAGLVELRPGEPYEQFINLSTLATANIPGFYSISMRILGDTAATMVVASAPPVFIQVEPQNSSGLKAACDRLATQIATTSSAPERAELASELPSIHDPVAVAGIRGLLGRGLGIDDDLIGALMQIGDEAAIDALGAALTNPDPDTARSAKSALALIQLTSSNAALRARAKATGGLP